MFKKILGYVLAESDIKEDEVRIVTLAPTVKSNTRIYHISDGEYIDFYAEISANPKKNAWSGEHLAVVRTHGETSDECITIYRVDDGYTYDVIYTPRADR